MSDASGNGRISTANTGKWLKRLDQANVSYFCWSLTNKNESSALLAPGSRKTGNWKQKDLSKAGRYIRKEYRRRGRKEFVLESFIEYEVKNCPVGAGQFFVIVAKNSDVATETDWKAM